MSRSIEKLIKVTKDTAKGSGGALGFFGGIGKFISDAIGQLPFGIGGILKIVGIGAGGLLVGSQVMKFLKPMLDELFGSEEFKNLKNSIFNALPEGMKNLWTAFANFKQNPLEAIGGGIMRVGEVLVSKLVGAIDRGLWTLNNTIGGLLGNVKEFFVGGYLLPPWLGGKGASAFKPNDSYKNNTYTQNPNDMSTMTWGEASKFILTGVKPERMETAPEGAGIKYIPNRYDAPKIPGYKTPGGTTTIGSLIGVPGATYAGTNENINPVTGVENLNPPSGFNLVGRTARIIPNSPMWSNFEAMAAEYAVKNGPINVTSSFRSREEQARLFADNPNNAAPPGKSLHEYGYAIDIDSTQDNALESSGLLKKYRFERPIKREKWHIQPIDIPKDFKKAQVPLEADSPEGEGPGDAFKLEAPIGVKLISQNKEREALHSMVQEFQKVMSVPKFDNSAKLLESIEELKAIMRENTKVTAGQKMVSINKISTNSMG